MSRYRSAISSWRRRPMKRTVVAQSFSITSSPGSRERSTASKVTLRGRVATIASRSRENPLCSSRPPMWARVTLERAGRSSRRGGSRIGDGTPFGTLKTLPSPVPR